MRTRFRSLGISMALALSLAVPICSLQAVNAVDLDRKSIHEAYNAGDFDKVVELIDIFNKANGTYGRADSITIAKNLAVVYSAHPKTREMGRYYMYRLLEMVPSAELVDMFVSDEIDRIFDKVRREFLTRQKNFGVDISRISLPESRALEPQPAAYAEPVSEAGAIAYAPPAGQAPSRESREDAFKESFWKRNAFWIAGGVGIAVAGTAALFIYSQEEPKSRVIVVQANNL